MYSVFSVFCRWPLRSNTICTHTFSDYKTDKLVTVHCSLFTTIHNDERITRKIKTAANNWWLSFFFAFGSFVSYFWSKCFALAIIRLVCLFNGFRLKSHRLIHHGILQSISSHFCLRYCTSHYWCFSHISNLKSRIRIFWLHIHTKWCECLQKFPYPRLLFASIFFPCQMIDTEHYRIVNIHTIVIIIARNQFVNKVSCFTV